MENGNPKGTEYNNIIETWEQNEKKRENAPSPGSEASATNEAPAENDLEKVIKQEASEYDNANKEDRVLSGDRATINDNTNDDSDV